MRHCDSCGIEISEERLEVLPHTMTCTKCSREGKMIGFSVSFFAKGTASELALVRPEDKEAVRLAERANKRNR